jgi:phosphate transport system permease protein
MRRTALADTMLVCFVRVGVGITLACLLGIIWQVVHLGGQHLSWAFLTADAENAGRDGGIAPMLWATTGILFVTVVVAVPLGLGVAVWLSEYVDSSRRWARATSLVLDALAGVPSIVFGLFGSAFFCDFLGLGFSLLAGGLTLACMVLPLVVRSAQTSLAALPDGWRLGAAAVGMSRVHLVRSVLLPAAAPGVAVGVMLGAGRALAETAALVFTSGYVDRRPTSLLESGRALSVHIYDLTMNVAGGDQAAYASAFVLMGLILFINAVTMGLGGVGYRRPGRGS